MLNPKTVTAYLLEQALLCPQDIVQGTFQIINRSQRNQNLSVLSSHGPSYFLKQGQHQTGWGSIDHEAQVYQWLKSNAQEATSLEAFLPEYVGFDPAQTVLIIRYLDGSRDLHQYHLQRGQFPKSLAAELGNSLAQLHELPISTGQADEISCLTVVQPWIFSIGQPELKIFHQVNKAALDFIKMVQTLGDIGVALNQLIQTWQPNALIHNDIKFDNILTYRKPTRQITARHSIKLIDWELAGLGDPMWDVGAIFSAYLDFWVRSMPMTEELPPEEMMALARYPLPKIQVAMITFWQSYCQHRKMTDIPVFLTKAAQFAAVRLLQSAFERVMASGQMTNHLICLLQLSLNLLKYPRPGITALLGIAL